MNTPSPGKLADLKDRLSAEIAAASRTTDATPLERFVAEALTSDEAKQKGIVDRVWMVSLPDAKKAIEAITGWNRRALATPDGEGREALGFDPAMPPFADGGLGKLLCDVEALWREEYVLGSDDGPDHEPTEFERWMLEDYFSGLISDERFFGPIRRALVALSKADACLAALASGGETALAQEVALLQEALRRYGDRIGMANAPPHLQCEIDRAMLASSALIKP